MNQDVKSKWVAALRSGRYKQGHGILRNVEGDQYCCLGVLCDVIDPNLWLQGTFGTFSYADGSTAILDAQTANQAELHDPEMWDLVRMNDREHATFEDIAQYIEKNL